MFFRETKKTCSFSLSLDNTLSRLCGFENLQVWSRNLDFSCLKRGTQHSNNCGSAEKSSIANRCERMRISTDRQFERWVMRLTPHSIWADGCCRCLGCCWRWYLIRGASGGSAPSWWWEPWPWWRSSSRCLVHYPSGSEASCSPCAAFSPPLCKKELM